MPSRAPASGRAPLAERPSRSARSPESVRPVGPPRRPAPVKAPAPVSRPAAVQRALAGRCGVELLLAALEHAHVEALRRARQALRELAQIATLDFLRGRQRQGIDEGDIARRLEIRQPRQRVADDARGDLLGGGRWAACRSTMQASTSSPRVGSGVAATALAATAGCVSRMLSTSTAEMFSPLRRITFLRRSTKWKSPSALQRTTSPVWNQPPAQAASVASSSFR